MASEGRQIERCHKHEQMAAKRLEKSEIVSEAVSEADRERGRRGGKIWIRLKKASSSLWGMQ